MMRIYSLLTILVLLSGLSGCITKAVYEGVEKKADEIRHGPDQLPQRNITDFNAGLRCMDNMFLSFNIGRGEYVLLLDELKDKTKKVDAGTRQMMISAISEMTKRSGAVRLVAYGADAGNLISYINETGNKGIYQNVPAFGIIGSISQYDDGVFREQADYALEAEGSNDGSSIGAGGGRSASSSLTFLTIDLSIITAHDLSVMSGVHTTNTVELYNKGTSTSIDAGISKTGISYGFSSNMKDAVGQSLRALVELSAIELIGKLTKTPYWKCLGMDKNHADIHNEISDWFYQLSANGTLHRTIKIQLALRGYYDGAINEQVTNEYLEAVARYQSRLGLNETGAVDLAFYSAFLNRSPVSEKKHDLAYVKKPGGFENKKKRRENKAKKANKVVQQPEKINLTLNSISETNQFVSGESVYVKVTSNEDGYLNCYFHQDGVLVQVFPNRFSSDGYIASGGKVVIPDSNRYSFVAGNSKETLYCFISKKRIDNDLPAELRVGDFEVLPVESVADIEQAYKTITNDYFSTASFIIEAK